MILILKAKAGLTAKKITITRGGKTFQQTVYVRAGKKKSVEDMKTALDNAGISSEQYSKDKKNLTDKEVRDAYGSDAFKDTLSAAKEEKQKKKKTRDSYAGMDKEQLAEEVIDIADKLSENRPDLEDKIDKVMYEMIDVENIRHESPQSLKTALRELSKLKGTKKK